MTKEERLVAFCQEAIRIPSFSGKEQGVAELMKRKMEEYGFDEVVIDKYGSVLGTIIGKRPGKTVLMDGHIDHVDVIDADQWNHDPFGAEIEDGKIYGRAASDMVGSVTAMISAAAQVAEDTGKDFAGKICVSCTVHEECFEGVSSREISKLAKPDFVIIGEATSTTVKIGQRGRAEVVVETEGVSCHSSNPEKGVNAVYAKHQIHIRIAFPQLVHNMLLVCHAAAQADDQPRLFLLQGFQRAHIAKHTLFGVLAHRTGVEQDQIGILRFITQTVTDVHQNTLDPLAVIYILLAAVAVHERKRRGIVHIGNQLRRQCVMFKFQKFQGDTFLTAAKGLSWANLMPL